MSCFLLHRWGKWSVYEHRFGRRSSLDSEVRNCVEVRQMRRCLRCHMAQDEEIRPGTMPPIDTMAVSDIESHKAAARWLDFWPRSIPPMPKVKEPKP